MKTANLPVTSVKMAPVRKWRMVVFVIQDGKEIFATKNAMRDFLDKIVSANANAKMEAPATMLQENVNVQRAFSVNSAKMVVLQVGLHLLL